MFIVSLTYMTYLAILCHELPAITDGHIFYQPDRTAPFDLHTVAMYVCDIGFSLQGNLTRMCTSVESSVIGVFEGITPACQRKQMATNVN